MVQNVLSEAWQLTKAHWLKAWLVVILIGLIGGLGPELLKLLLGEGSMLAPLLMQFITVPLSAGAGVVLARIARGETDTPVSEIFNGFSRFVPLIITAFVMVVVVGVGLVLLVVPGIIAALGLSFAPYLVLDRGLSAADALRASWQMMDGHKLDLFLLGVASMVIALLSAIPLGLGLLVTIPMLSFAGPVLYNRVLSQQA